MAVASDLTPEGYRSFHAIIAEHAERQPDKTFLHSIPGQRAVSYGELAVATNRVASYLRQQGFSANDRVLLVADNSVEFAIVYLGVLRYGATVCVVNTEMNHAHMREIVNAIAPRVIVYQSDLGLDGYFAQPRHSAMELGKWHADGGTAFFEGVSALPEEPRAEPVCAPHDAAVIFYTSGTEAKPKGVIYTHDTLFCNFDAVAAGFGLEATDCILEFRSYTWISAQELGLGAPFLRGASVMLANGFSRSHYLAWIDEFDVSVAVCVPAGIAMLLGQSPEPASTPPGRLRLVTSSSAPLLTEQWHAFESSFGVPVVQGYGSSEGGWTCAQQAADRRIGSVGKALKYQHVQIIGEHGEILPVGEVGEIVVQGRQQAFGYLLADGAEEELHAAPVRTGDLGFFDADRYLHVVGRVKDLIIRGGVNIAPVEIDSVIAELPGIAEVCTIGVPDPIYGEEVVSYVALKVDAVLAVDAILTHCRTKLPEFKIPKQIFYRDELFKTLRGKLDRDALRDDWAGTGGAN